MIKITATDKATPVLAAMIRRGKDRQGLHTRIATEAELLFRDYIGQQARIRHRSAQALGATPTGELEKAANSPEGTATATGARITLRPGYLFARAFRDVEIKPTGGRQFLTIPISAKSYGRRISDFPRGERKGLFAFVPRVRQKQDRTLLPSDKGILDVAEEAAKDHLLALPSTEGGAS